MTLRPARVRVPEVYLPFDSDNEGVRLGANRLPAHHPAALLRPRLGAIAHFIRGGVPVKA